MDLLKDDDEFNPDESKEENDAQIPSTNNRVWTEEVRTFSHIE